MNLSYIYIHTYTKNLTLVVLKQDQIWYKYRFCNIILAMHCLRVGSTHLTVPKGTGTQLTVAFVPFPVLARLTQLTDNLQKVKSPNIL